MKRKALFVGMLLASYATPSYAVFCDYPVETDDPNYGIVNYNGGGYDQDRDRIKVMQCANGEIRTAGSPTASYTLSLAKSLSEYVSTVTKTRSGGLKIFGFGGGKSRSVSETFIQKNYSSTFSVEYKAYLGNDVFVIDGNNPLTTVAQQAKANYCDFKRICGTHFVYQTEKGAHVTMAFRFVFGDAETKNGFDNNLSLNIDVAIPVYKIPVKIPVSFNLSNVTSNQSSTVKQNTQVEVYMFQEGGDVAALGRAVGSTNGEEAPIVSCSLNNLAACDSAISKAINYLASTEFVDGIKATPAIVNEAIRPFWEVESSLYALSNSELTPAIETARLNLADAYLQRNGDLSKAKQLLSSSLTQSHRNELHSLVSTLETELEDLRKTALICYSDLSQCEAKTNQLIGSLISYNQSELKFYLEDGLVAYYPFDGNALDASGNGNDGVVYGATLNKDRNGKANSAYSFKNSNITFPSQFFNAKADFSISGWFKLNSILSLGNQTIVNTVPHVGLWFGLNHGLNPGKKSTIYFSSTGGGWSFGKGGSATYQDAEWTHFLIIKRGSNIMVYEDNAIDNVINTDGLSFTIPNTGIIIGSVGGGISSHDLDGSIDDIRIYNRALTAEEIKQLYEGNSSTPNPPIGTPNNCKATYSFEGKLHVPCVIVPTGFGTEQIMSVDFEQKPLTLAFEVNPATLKVHTFKDACVATYSMLTGMLNIPCVAVGSDVYNADLKQRPNTLIFDVIDVR